MALHFAEERALQAKYEADLAAAAAAAAAGAEPTPASAKQSASTHDPGTTAAAATVAPDARGSDGDGAAVATTKQQAVPLDEPHGSAGVTAPRTRRSPRTRARRAVVSSDDSGSSQTAGNHGGDAAPKTAGAADSAAPAVKPSAAAERAAEAVGDATGAAVAAAEPAVGPTVEPAVEPAVEPEHSGRPPSDEVGDTAAADEVGAGSSDHTVVTEWVSDTKGFVRAAFCVLRGDCRAVYLPRALRCQVCACAATRRHASTSRRTCARVGSVAVVFERVAGGAAPPAVVAVAVSRTPVPTLSEFAVTMHVVFSRRIGAISPPIRRAVCQLVRLVVLERPPPVLPGARDSPAHAAFFRDATAAAVDTPAGATSRDTGRTPHVRGFTIASQTAVPVFGNWSVVVGIQATCCTDNPVLRQHACTECLARGQPASVVVARRLRGSNGMAPVHVGTPCTWHGSVVLLLRPPSPQGDVAPLTAHPCAVLRSPSASPVGARDAHNSPRVVVVHPRCSGVHCGRCTAARVVAARVLFDVVMRQEAWGADAFVEAATAHARQRRENVHLLALNVTRDIRPPPFYACPVLVSSRPLQKAVHAAAQAAAGDSAASGARTRSQPATNGAGDLVMCLATGVAKRPWRVRVVTAGVLSNVPDRRCPESAAEEAQPSAWASYGVGGVWIAARHVRLLDTMFAFTAHFGLNSVANRCAQIMNNASQSQQARGVEGFLFSYGDVGGDSDSDWQPTESDCENEPASGAGPIKHGTGARETPAPQAPPPVSPEQPTRPRRVTRASTRKHAASSGRSCTSPPSAAASLSGRKHSRGESQAGGGGSRTASRVKSPKTRVRVIVRRHTRRNSRLTHDEPTSDCVTGSPQAPVLAGGGSSQDIVGEGTSPTQAAPPTPPTP